MRVMTRLSVVIPHWPIDDEVDAALAECLASLPERCERIVVVNEGTGFARNVNLGLRVATGDFIAVMGNDGRVVEGDLYDLFVPGAVTSPLVEGKPGIEPAGFHGACWVVPRDVVDRIGFLDERFEGAFFEDDDYLERLRAAGVPTRQIASVRVDSRRVGLTMSKVPERAAEWYEQRTVDDFRRSGAVSRRPRTPNWGNRRSHRSSGSPPRRGRASPCRRRPPARPSP
jgi:glycosyltransferase involved in cell wall biosynthesis